MSILLRYLPVVLLSYLYHYFIDLSIDWIWLWQVTPNCSVSLHNYLILFWLNLSYFQVSKEGNSPFTYVIVDNQTWGPLPLFSLSLLALSDPILLTI